MPSIRTAYPAIQLQIYKLFSIVAVLWTKFFNFAEISGGTKIKEFMDVREFKEFNDAPIPKFSKFIKFPNLTKKSQWPMANG